MRWKFSFNVAVIAINEFSAPTDCDILCVFVCILLIFTAENTWTHHLVFGAFLRLRTWPVNRRVGASTVRNGVEMNRRVDASTVWNSVKLNINLTGPNTFL